MTRRERVRRAIHFQAPDHVPHFLPDGLPNDILWLWPSREPDRQPWRLGVDGREHRVDAWGTTWTRPVGTTNHGEKTNLAIPDLGRHCECAFPPQNDARHLDAARAAIVANNAADDPQYVLGVMPFAGLNEGTHSLIGLDTMLVSYYEDPDALSALIGRLAAAQRDSIRALAAIGCDGVMAYDDWGLQDRLMISLELVDRFFQPHYQANWALAHALGLDVWMHSCGYILPLLPRLQQWGLNVIQQDQQENMGLENLDVAVGGRLAFWCPVDIQQTMVYGSVDDVRAYVYRLVTTVGRHQGGLISMAYSSPETVAHAPEKTAAMCAAFRHYGQYAEALRGQ